MTKFQFRDFVDTMVNMYGVTSYLDNLVDDYEADADELDSPWFSCPECGEPILYEDYEEDMDDFISDDYSMFTCPICEEEMELR